MGGEETIEVQQGGRQHLKVLAAAVLALPPKQAFALLTHPENEKIFRHLEVCTYHQVLQRDEAAGKVEVESEHVASWRILALHGKVKTRLRVQQDFNALESRFQMVPRRFSMLRLFGGTWRVQEAPAPHVDGNGGGDGKAQPSGNCCLLTLEQELQPAIFLPPPLGGLLRQLACRQMRGIFEDLRTEADRINSGQPTLSGPSLLDQPATPTHAAAGAGTGEQAGKQQGSPAVTVERVHVEVAAGTAASHDA